MNTERTEEHQLQRATREGLSFSALLERQFKEPFRLATVGRHYEALLEAESIEAADHRKRCELIDHSQCGERMGVFRVRVAIEEIVTL